MIITDKTAKIHLSNTITNSFKISEDSFVRELSSRTHTGIDGGNLLTEAVHNAHVANSTESCFILSDVEILILNNGDFLYWDTFETRILRPVRPKTKPNKTGCWGIGLRILSYCDGLPNYNALWDKDNNKFYLRRWMWINEPVELTQKSSDQITGCEVVETEISKDKYLEYAKQDKFDEFTPTFVYSIKRFTDSSMVYDTNSMMRYIDFGFMDIHNFNTTIVDYLSSSRKKILRSRKLYYPYMIQRSNQYIPPMSVLDIPVTETLVYKDATFDLTLINTLTHGTIYEELKKHTNNGKDILTLNKKWLNGERGIRPRQIFQNQVGVNLMLVDGWNAGIDKLDKNQITQETTLIIQLKSGDFEFSQIKTEKMNEEFQQIINRKHYELVKKNAKLHYSPKKKENEMVDEIVEISTTDKNPTVKASISISISKITNKEIDIDILGDISNYQIRKDQGDNTKREYDYMVRKPMDKDFTLHQEFKEKTPKFEDTDGFLYRILQQKAKYHSLVIGKHTTDSQYKLDGLKEVLVENKVKSIVWCITYSDLITGNYTSFKKVYDYTEDII